MSIYKIFDDFDDYSKHQLKSYSNAVINIDEITNFPDNKTGLFEEIKSNKTFEEISNEYALSTPFGKNSFFYKANENSYREILNNRGMYYSTASKFPEIDFGKISWEEHASLINIKYH